VPREGFPAGFDRESQDDDMSTLLRRHAPLCAVLLLGACMPAAGSPAPARGAGTVADSLAVSVRFMQAMIVHHRQAVEMTALARERAGSDALRLLAERIAVSQEDELRQMHDWLQRRGAATPDAHAHHGPGHGGMPGMLTAEQLAALQASSGAGFDRLFLEFMIFHHEGALVMVEELLATPAATQDAELFLFATHVDSDQRIEIDRMRRMLSALRRDGE
jgi:uncharacterized protein (DUF305 family)